MTNPPYVNRPGIHKTRANSGRLLIKKVQYINV